MNLDLIKEEALEVTDIYYGAYLLVKGSALLDARMEEGRPRRQVIFYFKTDDNLLRTAHEYISGRAKANVNELRGHINHLKRLAYEALNKN